MFHMTARATEQAITCIIMPLAAKDLSIFDDYDAHTTGFLLLGGLIIPVGVLTVASLLERFVMLFCCLLLFACSLHVFLKPHAILWEVIVVVPVRAFRFGWQVCLRAFSRILRSVRSSRIGVVCDISTGVFFSLSAIRITDRVMDGSHQVLIVFHVIEHGFDVKLIRFCQRRTHFVRTDNLSLNIQVGCVGTDEFGVGLDLIDVGLILLRQRPQRIETDLDFRDLINLAVIHTGLEDYRKQISEILLYLRLLDSLDVVVPVLKV